MCLFLRRFFFPEHMFSWRKVIFHADHLLDLQPGAGHAAGRAVLQVISPLHQLWVAAGGSLSPPSLMSSLAPCPSLMITPYCSRDLTYFSFPQALPLCLPFDMWSESQGFIPDSFLQLG